MLPLNTITSLDIGTSKIAILMAQVKPNGRLEVIGQSEYPSHGLKHGVVVDIEKTTQSISEAIKKIELMTGQTVEAVTIGIAGSHISSRDTQGMVAVANNEVSPSDIARVLDSAKTIALSPDQHILHILPQEYTIDNQTGISQPVGMSGVRLEAQVHMVTCAMSALQNLKRCVEACGIRVERFVLQSLASSLATLTEDEKDLGVATVDIGDGTTDMAIYVDGAIRHTATIPIAGSDVTKDIAIVLRTPNRDAEHIKVNYGCAYSRMIKDDDKSYIQVQSVGGREPRQLSLANLVPVIEARYEELFEKILENLRTSGYAERLSGAGLVITGGGATIPGLAERAEEITNMPVRVGTPMGVDTVVSDTLEPRFATAIGLLLHTQAETAHQTRLGNLGNNTAQATAGKSHNLDQAPGAAGESALQRAKKWFANNF